MTENIDIDSEGAILSVQVTGEGPLLVMIPGGGGTGGRYARVAVHLAGHWTVATYDRRCCGASTGDRTAPFSMDQQARDAAAVIRGLGYERADVFGNSGGANIALALASAFPARIARLVVHEPPLTPLLVHAATRVLGDTVWALRLPAVLMAVVAVWLVARLTREVGGDRTAQALAAWGYVACRVQWRL